MLVNTKELSELTGLSVMAIRKLSNEGVIRNIKPAGKAKVYKLEEVQWLIDEMEDSMSIEDYATSNRYSLNTVYQYISDNVIEAVKIPFIATRVRRD